MCEVDVVVDMLTFKKMCEVDVVIDHPITDLLKNMWGRCCYWSSYYWPLKKMCEVDVVVDILTFKKKCVRYKKCRCCWYPDLLNNALDRGCYPSAF